MKKENQIKRKKTSLSSDEDCEMASKYSKVEQNVGDNKESMRRVTRKKSKQIDQPTVLLEKVTELRKESKSPVLRRSSRISSNTSSSKSSQENTEENKVDDAIIEPNANNEKTSMCEDAIEKLVPIMNSTLKHSPLMPQKTLNATVVLERLPQQSKLNETVVIQKAESTRNSKRSKERESIKKKSQDNTQSYKAHVYNNYNGLITDDESSPEIKKPKRQLGKKPINKKQIKDTSSSEDEIPNTPVERRLPAVTQDNKIIYKPNALFSPYAKESVKKRVEAFEQAVMHSPKSVDVDAPMRITRTKTRAMTTKEVEKETKVPEKNVKQILARKSLVKAKKISLAKQKKNDELKEVKESVVSYFTIIFFLFPFTVRFIR